MTAQERNEQKAANLTKHSRVIVAMRVLIDSNKFTQQELSDYMHGMMGYVTMGELMDVYEHLGLAGLDK
jgi:hypothetical protein